MFKNSANVDLHANDTTIYDLQCNIDQLESNLQFSLNALHVWCRQNGMVLNTEKTNVMLITSRQRRSNLPNTNLSLRYNEIDAKMTTISKILGVQLMKICCGIISFSMFPKRYLLIYGYLAKYGSIYP